jgi:hypothetical protein
MYDPGGIAGRGVSMRTRANGAAASQGQAATTRANGQINAILIGLSPIACCAIGSVNGGLPTIDMLASRMRSTSRKFLTASSG